MGNRAAVIFGDGQASGNIGVCLVWNGGPESIYAFAKALASYRLSQSPGSAAAAVDCPSLAGRFVQLVTNYFAQSESDFRSLHIVPGSVKPGDGRMPTENGIFSIRSDFSVDRHDFDGRRWSKKERLDEFARVLEHPYWTGEDTLIGDLRRANNPSFLRRFNSEGDVEFHEFKPATLPVERELQDRLAAARPKRQAGAAL